MTGRLTGLPVTAGETALAEDMSLNLSTGASGIISIENGNVYSSSRTVTVYITASDDATLYQMSDNPNFIGAVWNTIPPSRTWIFDSDGEKRLYAKFADANGLESAPASDSIIVDTSSPLHRSVSINNGALATNSTAVTLNLSATDATTSVAQMKISNTPDFVNTEWESFTISRLWTIPPGDGAKTVYVLFRDIVGNETTQALSDDIILDTTIPASPSVTIQEGAYTSNPQIHLNLSVSGATFMKISEDPTFAGVQPIPYTPTMTVTLSGGDGDKTIYVEYFDNAGNESDLVSASVVLGTINQEADITPPSNTTATNFINNGATSTDSTTVMFSLSATDDIGVAGYYVSENYTGTAPMNPSVSDPEWELVPYAIDYTANVLYTFRENYPKGTAVYIYVWFKDAAGNISPVASDSIKYYQWTTSTIDSTDNVGEYSSIGVDSNYKVHISYFDRTNNALKYTTNKLGSWTTVTIDSGSSGSGVGMYTDLAIDLNDNLHIVYQGIGGLGYVTNITGTWVKSIIESTGSNASIAIDSSDNIHISYFDGLSYLLKYATNISGSWTSSTIDNAGAFGRYSCIAIDSNNKVHISYEADLSNNSNFRYVLKYATNSSGSWATTYIDDMEFGDTSIALDSNNKVHISYYSPKLKYATNISGSWAIQILDETMGAYSSTAIDSNNKVHISYMGGSGTGQLKYVTNTLGPWLTSMLSNTREESTAIAIDSNNNIHISSYDFQGYNDGNLKYTTDSGN